MSRETEVVKVRKFFRWIGPDAGAFVVVASFVVVFVAGLAVLAFLAERLPRGG